MAEGSGFGSDEMRAADATLSGWLAGWLAALGGRVGRPEGSGEQQTGSVEASSSSGRQTSTQ